NKFWLLRSSKPVTSVQRVGSSENLRKTALQGGFFSFTEQKITRREKGSQEEHLLEDGLGVMIAICKCCTTHQANKVFLLT
ncbi:hypothetical protein OFO29_42795, partial [Escherichia coli]|nr:hypothetical protein [Escherichia coli]